MWPAEFVMWDDVAAVTRSDVSWSVTSANETLNRASTHVSIVFISELIYGIIFSSCTHFTARCELVWWSEYGDAHAVSSVNQRSARASSGRRRRRFFGRWPTQLLVCSLRRSHLTAIWLCCEVAQPTPLLGTATTCLVSHSAVVTLLRAHRVWIFWSPILCNLAPTWSGDSLIRLSWHSRTTRKSSVNLTWTWRFEFYLGCCMHATYSLILWRPRYV